MWADSQFNQVRMMAINEKNPRRLVGTTKLDTPALGELETGLRIVVPEPLSLEVVGMVKGELVLLATRVEEPFVEEVGRVMLNSGDWAKIVLLLVS